MKSNTAQSGNQGSPQPGSPRSQRAAVHPCSACSCIIASSTALMQACKRGAPSAVNKCMRCSQLSSVWSVFFLWSAPVAFRRVALETPEWTSRDSNHHRQSVSAGKTNAIPTEPSGRLLRYGRLTMVAGSVALIQDASVFLWTGTRSVIEVFSRGPGRATCVSCVEVLCRVVLYARLHEL